MTAKKRTTALTESEKAGRALWAAALNGRCDEVERLVASGAHGRHHGTDGDTALTLSAYQGCGQCVKTLLPVSDPLAKNKNGSAALGIAANMGWQECVKTLLPVSDARAVDELDIDALMEAAGGGNPACVELLARAGDPMAVSHRGEDALMMAARRGCARSARALLPGSDASRRDGVEGMTALMFAAKAKALECVRELLPVSDVFARDKKGRSAWDWAMGPEGGDERVAGAIEAVERSIADGEALENMVPTAKPARARRLRV